VRYVDYVMGKAIMRLRDGIEGMELDLTSKVNWRNSTLVLICALLVSATSWGIFGQAEAIGQSSFNRELNVAFSELSFAGMNRNDAEAAFKAYLVSMARQRGYDMTARTEVFASASDFEAAIRAGKVHLAIIPSWDYLSMDIQDFVDPYFVAVTDEGIQQRYLLVTPRGSGLNTFAALRGKSIAVLENSNAYLSMRWMETALLKEKLGTPDSFFGRVEKVAKASAAVLPVFFGKYQACVVNQAAFDVMKELNPQIGERLQPVVVSEPLLGDVICLSKSGWASAKYKENTNKGLAEIQTWPAGQQILMLFRIREMSPYKPEYLETVRALRATHDRLAGQLARARQEK